MLPPLDGSYNALASPNALMRVRRKLICPVPLCYTRDVNHALEMEADMSCGEGGWGVRPFDGPTRKWPSDVLHVLRAVRAMRGIIQTKNVESMKTDVPAS